MLHPRNALQSEISSYRHWGQTQKRRRRLKKMGVINQLVHALCIWKILSQENDVIMEKRIVIYHLPLPILMIAKFFHQIIWGYFLKKQLQNCTWVIRMLRNLRWNFIKKTIKTETHVKDLMWEHPHFSICKNTVIMNTLMYFMRTYLTIFSRWTPFSRKTEKSNNDMSYGIN